MASELLAKSLLFHEEILWVFGGASPYPGERFAVAMIAAEIALEHADGVRSLVAAGLAPSAAALLRVQFEALTRAMWAHFSMSRLDLKSVAENHEFLGALTRLRHKAR